LNLSVGGVVPLPGDEWTWGDWVVWVALAVELETCFPESWSN
jgi:hypothetical protein